jgi:arsenite-transporting ATPase
VTLGRFLDGRPALRLLFFGGKGGVGKTAVAAAVAERLAGGGLRTLIASLNPDHALSGVFGQDLGGGSPRPVAGAPGLWAVEVDVGEAVAAHRADLVRRLRRFVRWGELPVDPRPFLDVAAGNPAVEASALFERMVDLALGAAGSYDRVVFDTAAIGGAVRLVGRAGLHRLWLDHLMENRRRALDLRVQLAFHRDRALAEVARDPLLADLAGMRERMDRAAALLADAERTAFFLVTLPQALAVCVARRFIGALRACGIPVGGLVVNRVLGEEAEAAAWADGFLAARLAEQAAQLALIREEMGDLVRAVVPLAPREPGCVEDVRRLGAALFADAASPPAV